MATKTKTLSPEGRAVLAKATIEPNAVILNTPNLDRALYREVDEFLKALGGKWSRGDRAHLFAKGTREVRASIEDGRAVDRKRTYEQFYTPDGLALRMVRLASEIVEIADGTHVLEPSAGCGSIVNQAMQRGASVSAVEIDPSNLEALLTVGGQRQGWMRALVADFMTWDPRDMEIIPAGSYFHEIDAVLMNPPFSRNQDVAHVRRAFGFLRPGGVLVAIMSPHWTFAEDRPSREFRQWIGALARLPDIATSLPRVDGEYIRTPNVLVEYLPAGSFKQAGTEVETVMVRIVKPGESK